MSEEEMKALVEMNNMLKAKLEQQTKTYQQSLREMQSEIDNLQRNCDVFNEQMNDAVEVTVKLKQDNQELKRIAEAYKDKEYKLRDYLSNTEFEERTAYDKSFCEGVYNTKEKALKILNEGDIK